MRRPRLLFGDGEVPASLAGMSAIDPLRTPSNHGPLPQSAWAGIVAGVIITAPFEHLKICFGLSVFGEACDGGSKPFAIRRSVQGLENGRGHGPRIPYRNQTAELSIVQDLATTSGTISSDNRAAKGERFNK